MYGATTSAPSHGSIAEPGCLGMNPGSSSSPPPANPKAKGKGKGCGAGMAPATASGTHSNGFPKFGKKTKKLLGA